MPDLVKLGRKASGDLQLAFFQRQSFSSLPLPKKPNNILQDLQDQSLIDQ